MKLIFLLVVLLSLLSCSLSKGMWGSRKKRDKEEEVTPPVMSDLKMKQRQAVPAAQMDGLGAGGLEEILEMYLNMMENLLLSDDFDRLVNPESLRTLLSQVPGMSENLELETLLNSAEFNDPIQLKLLVAEGIKQIRTYAKEFIAIMNDPEQLAAVMDQLPPEVKQIVEGLKTGDMSALQDIVNNLPGLEESQKSMLTALMSGNTEALTEQMSELMSNTDQLEAARQQFLANPEMAQSMGIPSDVLNDPKKWAEAMAQGMEALGSMGGNSKEDKFSRLHKAA